MSAVPLPPAMSEAPPLRWGNRFAALGERFYSALPAQGVPDPQWVAVSDDCARLLGLPDGWHEQPAWQALHALGVPTTRALCVTASPLPVRRESIESAAVCTRVAPSFIRFGHFEHFTHTAQDHAALRRLADFVIDAYLPACRDAAQPYVALLESVAQRTAELMAHDFTIAFRRLARFGSADDADNHAVRDLFLDREGFDAWAAQYRERLRAEGSDHAARAEAMNRVNPKFILRNHLAQEAIHRAEGGDFGEVQRLLKVLSHPYDEQPEHAAYADFPPDWAQHIEVSCSS